MSQGQHGSQYKPTEHEGLKMDGTPDKRVSSEHGFGGSSGPDPHVEGAKGGQASGGGGGEKYKPSEHGGLKEDGTPDKRTSSEHGFGGASGPDPHEAGRKGGLARGGSGGEEDPEYKE